MLEFVEELMIEKASQAPEIKGFDGDFRWLSNFYPIEPFVYDGVAYSTTENYYQAMKTLDKAERQHIASLPPNKAKRYASSYNKKFICRDDWDMIKLEVMEYALRRKFSQPKFQKYLLATRDIYIEETNAWGDIFWGCSLAGEGANKLGLLIQKLRTELQEGRDLSIYKPVIAPLLKKKLKPLP